MYALLHLAHDNNSLSVSSSLTLSLLSGTIVDFIVSSASIYAEISPSTVEPWICLQGSVKLIGRLPKTVTSVTPALKSL